MAMAGRYVFTGVHEGFWELGSTFVAGIGWRVWRFGVWRWRFGLLGGMSFLVGFEQLAETDLGVDLRSIELGVSEYGLNGSYVRPVVVHERGHGVSVNVTCTRLADAGTLDVTTAVLGERIGINGFAEIGDEEGLLFGIDG